MAGEKPTRRSGPAPRSIWQDVGSYPSGLPPAGFATWNDFYRELGVPEEELVDGADRISDPEGHGPSIWFHVVPDAKAVKNRLHLDIYASGERRDPIETRRKRVDAEASRLAGLGATISGALPEEGLDHYAVGIGTRKATSSISTDRSSRGSNHVKVKSTSKAGGRTGRPGFAPGLTTFGYSARTHGL